MTRMPPSPFARVPLQVIQGALAALALLSGAQLMNAGAGLPPEAMVVPDNIGIDSMMRFIGGCWAGLGLVLAAGIPRIAQKGLMLRAAWAVVLLGGLCRLVGLARFGNENRELLFSGCVEVLAPLTLGAWQVLLAGATPAAAPRPGPRAASPTSRLLFQALLGLSALLALYIGGRFLYFGTPLPPEIADAPGSQDLRVTLHFVAGVWLGLGAVLAFCVPRPEDRGPAMRVACLLVFLGGLGRLMAILRFGADGGHVPVVTAMELLLPVALGVWQFLLEGPGEGSAAPAGPMRHTAVPTPQNRVPTAR